jgi:MFS family permease
LPGRRRTDLYLGALGDRYGRKLMLVLGTALSIPAAILAAAALTKSFSSAEAVAHQYPHYASAITSAARSSFVSGSNWAYAAGIIAVVLGAVLIFFQFPSKEDEQRLLAEYHAQDTAAPLLSPPDKRPALST